MNLIDRWRQRRVRVWKRASREAVPAVTLVDQASGMAAAWAEAFHDCEGVAVLEGDLLTLSCDAVVSPANSFADMSGGIDKAIDDHYAGEAQTRVRQVIARDFYGELPVGSAVVTHDPNRRLPFLISAPTMRVPGEIRGSINAYLAMRAALVAVLRHNESSPEAGPQIRSLAVPGLGTGIGGLLYEEAAEQMRTAYDNVLGGGWRRVVHPLLAPFALGRSR